MCQNKLIIKLDGLWTLINSNCAAECIGVTEDIFNKHFVPMLPKIEFSDGSIYYSNFDINWYIKQLRTRNLNITEINDAP
jgi:hypothetical protein